jgi:hypothetical protein
VHHECPNKHPERYGTLDTSRELDDDSIVRCAVQAYQELGFTGMVGWIYYNEPLLQAERMFTLMDRIKAAEPRAKFILWTNGMLIPADCDQYRQFSEIVVSGYNDDSKRGVERLHAWKINVRWVEKPGLDDRLVQLEPKDPQQPCLRPFTEFIIDAYGNTHICCYDWQGKATLGNVLVGDFATMVADWRKRLPEIAGERMTDKAPAFCQDCGHRWERYQLHDEVIVERARRFRTSLRPEAAIP